MATNDSVFCGKQANYNTEAIKDGTDRIKFSVERILHPNFGVRCVEKAKLTPKLSSSLIETDGRFDSGSVRSSTSVSDEDECDYDNRLKSNGCSISSTGVSKETKQAWPAWIFCTRYSDRPSSGPRSRRVKSEITSDEKRPRTAFTGEQLARLKTEFTENRYLSETRRQALAKELGLNEAQIKIWFQNKRAKIKKSKGEKNPLALQLMAQGLYNHSTIGLEEENFLNKMALKGSSIL